MGYNPWSRKRVGQDLVTKQQHNTKSKLLEDEKFVEILKGIFVYFQSLYRFEILAV